MTQPTQQNYDAAQAYIKAGKWSVDPIAGVVCGIKGEPFRRRSARGYIHILFRDVDDWRRQRMVMAHRVIWEYANGPLAGDLVINHLNGVKTDNRIANLDAVSQKENNRHARETGLNPPVRGERSGKAKLTEDQVRDIFRRAWAGEDQRTIGARYSVSREAVVSIKHGRTWAHLHHPDSAAS